MANHFSILALRTPWTVWKGKKIGHWKMNFPCWLQLCNSLIILWHCLSLGLEWKLTFSSPVATAEFSKFAGILSAALSQHHLLRFEIVQLEFHHLPAAYVGPNHGGGNEDNGNLLQKIHLVMDLHLWTSPDGQHRNQIDYILCSQRWRSSIQSAKRRPWTPYCQIQTKIEESGENH